MRNWLLGAAIGVPGVVLALAFGVLGANALATDRSPVMAPQARSLAEAAGNRDAADVVQRLLAGESATAVSEVRIPLKIAGAASLSPLEAAVLSEWTPMIQLLVDAGALQDARTLVRLRCMATRERDRDTISLLRRLDQERPFDCEGVPVPSYTRALPR
jgi:hypothetical protein